MKTEFIKYDQAIELLRNGFVVKCFRNNKYNRQNQVSEFLGKQWTISDEKHEYRVHHKTIERLMRKSIIESCAPYRIHDSLLAESGYTIEFTDTETKLKGKATIKNGECVNISLVSKVGRSHYYHALNYICAAFREQYPQYQ